MKTSNTDLLKELEGKLERAGFSLTTYSPGDGATRYRISPGGLGYFEHAGLSSALGLAEAVIMLQAFLIGYLWGYKETL